MRRALAFDVLACGRESRRRLLILLLLTFVGANRRCTFNASRTWERTRAGRSRGASCASGARTIS
jgi:hypothetical protein